MSTIKPFRAYRPPAELVHLVASRSYVTYSDEQLKDKLRYNPYSFIHIIHPDFEEEQPSEPGSTERFQKVRKRFDEFVSEGNLILEEKPAYYIYRQSKDGLDCTGIIAGVSVNDYLQGKIKIHEQTLQKREELFCDYLDTTNFNAEPILLCHNDIPELNAFYQHVRTSTPDYNFRTADKVLHQLWPISDAFSITTIESHFRTLRALYIADGHHRSASSALLAQRRQVDGRPLGNADYFMSYIIPASALVIHGYHRLVKSLGALSADDFLSQLSLVAEVTPLVAKSQLPKVGTIDIYLQKKWYRLDFSPSVHLELPDADWLTDQVLKPILGISDLRNDSRISFEPETTGTDAIVKLVDSGKFACAFLLHPVPFDQLKLISDQGRTMPPKSTWIEPKLRSGLTIYEFNSL
ncbi:MAG: hypothetical protein RL226_1268 [Bacteroidota bacterium]